MRRWGVALLAASLLAAQAACVRIERRPDPNHPTTFEGIDAMCRRSARDYRQQASAYARCMHEHGYPNQGADDY